MNNNKSLKPKQDRQGKLNKSSMMILKDLSQVGISVDTTLTQVKDEQSQCRICLQREDQIGGKELFSVCKCTGSVKYLHEQCFVLWVNSSLQQKKYNQKKKMISQGNQCQLCKFLIPIKSSTFNQCASCSLLKLRIKTHPYLFSIFITILTLCIVLISFLIPMMVKVVAFDGQNIATSVVLICLLIVFFCLAVGIAYSCVNFYFIQQKNIVLGFGDSVRGSNLRNDNSQVLPLNQSSSTSGFNSMINKKVLPQPQNTQINQSLQYLPQTSIRVQQADSVSNENLPHVRDSLSHLGP